MKIKYSLILAIVAGLVVWGFWPVDRKIQPVGAEEEVSSTEGMEVLDVTGELPNAK